MKGFDLVTCLVPAEYLILAAVFLVLFDFLLGLLLLFIRNDALYTNHGINLSSNTIVSLVEIAFILFSLIVFDNDKLCVILALPIITFAIVFTAMFIWGLIQMASISSRSTEIFETLVGVIEAGDENLNGHSLHVQNLTMLIYDYLPLKDRLFINSVNLQYASLFLDIGKLGIPRSIIAKKGKLLPKEKELIQRHPEICVKIFDKISSFTTVTYWIKYHHERVDGTGYYQLKGNKIPLASRILAVADTYSAITMDRSYRPSLPYENAIAELRLAAGTQLDSRIVEIFCSIPKNKINNCMNDVRERMKKYQAGNFNW